MTTLEYCKKDVEKKDMRLKMIALKSSYRREKNRLLNILFTSQNFSSVGYLWTLEILILFSKLISKHDFLKIFSIIFKNS